MPWLSRPSSADEGEQSPKSSRTPEAALKHHINQPHATISFIPAQIDGLCGTRPAHHKQAAWQLLLQDMRILSQNLDCLPAMIRASFSSKVMTAYFGTPLDARETLLQLGLATMQIWMFAVMMPAFLMLPGFMFATFVGICWLVTSLMTMPLYGSRVLTVECEKNVLVEDFSDERWIYINGLMCSNRSLRSQCSRLANVFGRPVMGVHNRTSGLVADLFIFFAQRCLNISTPCTVTLASQIRDACLTNYVRKVVLLSHSTGSLHVSIALDQLHTSLPVDILSKLEVYTFGSAAAHLSNPSLKIENVPNNGTSLANGNYTRPDGSIASPVKATLASLGHRVEDHERVMPHTEHYALASDLFARCGVLYNTQNVLDNRFCGRVFVMNESKCSCGQKSARNCTCTKSGLSSETNFGGFLMNEHYLDLLFPDSAGGLERMVLDHAVRVDVETAEKREFTAQGVALPQKATNCRHSPRHTNMALCNTHPESPDMSPKTQNRLGYDRGEKRASWETAAMLGIGGVGKARSGARECEGKTVRQLSRLWRYTNGGRPVGEGVALMNGVGNGIDGKVMSGNGMGMMQ